jgi:hypothetical protein
MSESLLTRLQERVKQAAVELVSVKKERTRLAAELDLIRSENKRARRVLREHSELIQDREKLKERLQKLLENLDKLKV